MKDKLTYKQEKFIQGLLSGLSQREAYKQAYNTSKMKDDTIDNKAYILFKKGEVRARYDKLHNTVIEKMENEGIVSHEKIIKEIAGIAFDDISNYLEYSKNESSKYGIDILVKDSNTIDTRNISEVSIGKDGFKFKMYCKDTALYKLAEIFNIKEVYGKSNKKDKELDITIDDGENDED